MKALNYDLAPHVAKFRIDTEPDEPKSGKEARFPVLMYLLMRTNPRNRTYPKIETIAAETGYGRQRVIDALRWLERRGAITNIPKEKRIDDELRIHPNNAVYELTGVIKLKKKTIRYLYNDVSSENVPTENRKQQTNKKSVRKTNDVSTVKEGDISTVNESPSLYELRSIKRTEINELESPPPTPTSTTDGNPGASENGGGGDNRVLTAIEMLLAENGVNISSWKHAAGWTLEQLQVIVDRAKEPGVKSPPAYIVSQLKSDKAHEAVQLELDTRKDAPAAEESVNELADLASQDYTPVERKPAIPPFEPIIDGWKKNVSAPDTWQHGVLPALAGQFHRATYNSWIAGSQVVAYEGQEKPPVLTVVATSDYARDWLKQRMIKTVLELAKQHFGEIAIRVIAPSEVNERLYASRVRIESKPNPAQFFSKGIGWIGRDGDEQHEGSAEPEPPASQPKAQESNRLSYDPATLSPELVWSKILGGLRHNDLNRHQAETYLSNTEVLGHIGNEIYVQVGGHTLREFRTHLKDKVNARIDKVTQGHWRIRFVTRDDVDKLPEDLIRLQEAV